MKIIVQEPDVFLPPLWRGQMALCDCAAGARLSRKKRENYRFVHATDINKRINIVIGHNAPYVIDKKYSDAENLIGRKILGPKKHKHESVLEHGYFSVDFVMSRIASHEIVRHRHCGITQESTRYVPLHSADEIIFIKPPHYPESDCGEYSLIDDLPSWADSAFSSFCEYTYQIDDGFKRESARYLLPHTIACDMRITASLREWRHIISVRTSKQAAPEMRYIFEQVKEYMRQISPVLVEDL